MQEPEEWPSMDYIAISYVADISNLVDNDFLEREIPRSDGGKSYNRGLNHMKYFKERAMDSKTLYWHDNTSMKYGFDYMRDAYKLARYTEALLEDDDRNVLQSLIDFTKKIICAFDNKTSNVNNIVVETTKDEINLLYNLSKEAKVFLIGLAHGLC